MSEGLSLEGTCLHSDNLDSDPMFFILKFSKLRNLLEKLFSHPRTVHESENKYIFSNFLPLVLIRVSRHCAAIFAAQSSRRGIESQWGRVFSVGSNVIFVGTT